MSMRKFIFHPCLRRTNERPPVCFRICFSSIPIISKHQSAAQLNDHLSLSSDSSASRLHPSTPLHLHLSGSLNQRHKPCQLPHHPSHLCSPSWAKSWRPSHLCPPCGRPSGWVVLKVGCSTVQSSIDGLAPAPPWLNVTACLSSAPMAWILKLT